MVLFDTFRSVTTFLFFENDEKQKKNKERKDKGIMLDCSLVMYDSYPL